MSMISMLRKTSSNYEQIAIDMEEIKLQIFNC